ncbi:hypothetical protein IV102_18345 [bacterium]|nr:hypothetical protein [bacterium]
MKRFWAGCIWASLLGVTPLAAQTEKPPLAAESRRVDRFLIEGNTLLPPEEIDAVLKHYQGRDLTLDQMKEAAADVTSIYQRRGYYLVRAIVPQQTFDSPQVKLLVV